MDSKDKSLGEIVRHYRKSNNLSIKEFIEKLPTKVSPAFMTKLEVYGEVPKPEFICEIAELIGYPAEELLEISKNTKIEHYHKTLEKKYKDALGFYRYQKTKQK